MPRRKGPTKVSPTSLNLLRECPRCFWLQLKEGVSRPRGAFPSLPSALDRLAKAACKPFHGAYRLPSFLVAAGLEGRLVDPGLAAWKDPDTGLLVSGFLDECLELPGQGFAPLDHKTRGNKVERINASYYVQLDIYALMLEGNGRPILGEGYLVYYIPDFPWDPANDLSFTIDIRRVRVNPNRALALVKEARRVLDLHQPPGRSLRCDFCRWAADSASINGGPHSELSSPLPGREEM